MSLELHTVRLLLRPWRDEDVAVFAAMFADPAVMEFLGPPQGRAAIDAIVGRVRAHFDRHGFGWWAAELKETGAFIGFVGLSHISFEAPFTPAVEVGWRPPAPIGARAMRPKAPARHSKPASRSWICKRSSPSPCRPTRVRAV